MCDKFTTIWKNICALLERLFRYRYYVHQNRENKEKITASHSPMKTGHFKLVYLLVNQKKLIMQLKRTFQLT